jgi:hypothetical protein
VKKPVKRGHQLQPAAGRCGGEAQFAVPSSLQGYRVRLVLMSLCCVVDHDSEAKRPWRVCAHCQSLALDHCPWITSKVCAILCHYLRQYNDERQSVTITATLYQCPASNSRFLPSFFSVQLQPLRVHPF